MITGPCVFQPAGSKPENNKLILDGGMPGFARSLKKKCFKAGTKENISLMGV